MFNISIVTLGCRVNQYESECLSQELSERGYNITELGSESDLVIVNTCTVTAESDRKSRQYIRRALGVNDECTVVVTGCYASTGDNDKKKISDRTFFVPNTEKSEIADIVESLLLRGEKKDPGCSNGYRHMSLERASRAREYIKIEDGCDKRCTYCIIPSARGHIISKPADLIIEETNRLCSTGCREITLVGIETASYGADSDREPYYGYSLANLMKRIDNETDIERLTLASLDPRVMSERFLQDIAGIRSLLPHFHISVQSGSTTVLNRMKRQYNADILRRNIALTRQYINEVTFSADIIVGFPGETEEEFMQTAAFAEETGFMHLHIFPYSDRKGTEASAMNDKLSTEEKNKRLKRLQAIQSEKEDNLLDDYVSYHSEGRPVSILVEKYGNGIAYGHSEHYIDIELNTDGLCCPGEIIMCNTVSRSGKKVIAEKS